MMDIKKMRLLPVLLVLLVAAGCTSEKKSYADRMEAEHKSDIPVANAASHIEQAGEVVTEMVSYARINGKNVEGYLARPKGRTDDLPGIIVIHEWWGLNDNIRMMTRRLAGEGYMALAVDLYNGQAAQTSGEAKKYMQQVSQNTQLAIDNLSQAAEYLDDERDADDIGVIGWCFGGGWSLQTALHMPDEIDATVIYYGQLVQDAKRLKKLDMPVLGIFGAEDDGIPKEEVNKFRKTLNRLNKDAEIHIYDGADHAFANPSGNRYNKKAAKDAWQKTISFLHTHLEDD